MNRLIRSSIAAVAVVSAQFAVSTAAYAETTLTLSNWLPPKHVIVAEMMVPWIKKVEQATEGRVKVKILPKPLGKPPAHFDIAREGTADLTYGIHGYQPGRFLLTSVAEMPFLGNDGANISVAYWRTYEKFMAKAGEHRDVKLLGLFTHGPGQIMVYPLVDIRRASVGVRDLVTALEQCVVELLAERDIDAVARRDAPGVYCDGRKVASLGLRIRRGSSYHGMALNVDVDKEPFSRINPCGFRDLEITNLRELGIGTPVADLEDEIRVRLLTLLNLDPAEVVRRD